MKKGDVVIIKDYSYSNQVVTGKLRYVDGRNKKYTVVEIGCSFPLEDNYQPEKWRSDTVIQAIDGGEVIFIHGTFLRPVPPKHKVMIDVVWGNCVTYGEVIEISDKLYEEIKRDSQTK